MAPPPNEVEILPDSVELMTLRLPALEIAPPAAPELVLKRQSRKVSVPALTTALALAPEIPNPERLDAVPVRAMKMEVGFVVPTETKRSELPGPTTATLPVISGSADCKSIVPVAEIWMVSAPGAAFASRIALRSDPGPASKRFVTRKVADLSWETATKFHSRNTAHGVRNSPFPAAERSRLDGFCVFKQTNSPQQTDS